MNIHTCNVCEMGKSVPGGLDVCPQCRQTGVMMDPNGLELIDYHQVRPIVRFLEKYRGQSFRMKGGEMMPVAKVLDVVMALVGGLYPMAVAGSHQQAFGSVPGGAANQFVVHIVRPNVRDAITVSVADMHRARDLLGIPQEHDPSRNTLPDGWDDDDEPCDPNEGLPNYA